MRYPFTVTCLTCGAYAELVDIIRVDDNLYPPSWNRVIMRCGDTFTLPSGDAAEIGRVAAGALASTAFQHPDRGDEDGFIIVRRGPRAH